MEDFRSELTKNTPPPQLELLMEDLGISVLSLPRIPPPEIGTSHEALFSEVRLSSFCYHHQIIHHLLM